jgi:DNA-binding beta-propeller fold protein YncE
VRTYAFVAGRWESTLTIIDVDAALAGKDAIVGRLPTSMSGACALPVSIEIDRVRGRIFVVNHGGRATPDAVARMPHGHAGTIAVLDLERALAGRTDALISEIDAGGHGAVACALTPDGNHLLVTLAEGAGTEDGGCAIAVFDAETLELKTRCLMAHYGAASQTPSPDISFGAFPNPNGIAIAKQAGLVFTANGGSNDVSVLRLDALVAGEADAEIGRINVPSGPFGLSIDPKERYLVTADREDARTGQLGNTVSLIELSSADTPAEASVISAHVGTRPFVPVFSPDGRKIYVTCQATGTLSEVDADAALLKNPAAERHLTLVHPAGAPASPRGLAISTDGSLLAVSGGAKSGPATGVVWFISAENFAVRASVTGAGNEPYLIAMASFS